MVDPLPRAQALQDARLLLPAVGRDQREHRFPNDLVSCVTKDAFGALVPAGDDPVQVLANDRVVRRIYYGGEKIDRKSTRLNSSHSQISYAVFCLKKKNITDA